MIRAILFDCFGVLTESRWTAFVSKLEPSVQREVSSLHHSYERGFIKYEEYRSEVIRLTGLSQQEADDIFIHRRGYRKNEALLEFIAKLSKDYKIGLLSNAGTSWVKDSFLTSEQVGLFDDMVLSYEVGLTKPDLAIYRLACERLNIEPEEGVFVDDQLGYCIAAKDAKMQALVYKNFVQFKHDLEELLNDTNY